MEYVIPYLPYPAVKSEIIMCSTTLSFKLFFFSICHGILHGLRVYLPMIVVVTAEDGTADIAYVPEFGTSIVAACGHVVLTIRIEI